MFAKSFRNTLIASTLLVGASILASPAAFAQNAGDIGGTVAEVNTITYNASGTGSALVTGTAVSLGTLEIQNNDPQGWTLAVTSTNGGRLERSTGVGTTDTTMFVVYENLTVDGTGLAAQATYPASLDLTPGTPSGTLVVADYTQAVAAKKTGIAVSADISTTGVVGSDTSVAAASLPAGTYTDTLTFTLTSNE